MYVVSREMAHGSQVIAFQQSKSLAEKGALSPGPTLTDRIASVLDRYRIFDMG